MTRHHPDLHSLTAPYALHALDAAEREAFDAHLAHCEECRGEVAEFEATAARLASAVAQDLPDEFRQRTLTAVEGVRQLPPRVPATRPATGIARRLRRRAVPLALAASIAAAVAFAGLAAWQQQGNEDARRRALQAERRLEVVSGVLAAPDARTVHGRTTNGALATVVTSDRQNRAVFTATGLPAPAPGHTYQLWLDHEGTMRPAGLLGSDGTVLVDGDPADATAVGLTLEPDGGSAQPTTQPLLLLSLQS
ncbi:anti-sigma factor [Streptomyces sp. NPDC007863]|uniref:anti-sigma factor n=1 Tax=Streptomyces sp. NPDC007863 TaxID=3154894 RepID=UPI00340B5872